MSTHDHLPQDTASSRVLITPEQAKRLQREANFQNTLAEHAPELWPYIDEKTQVLTSKIGYINPAILYGNHLAQTVFWERAAAGFETSQAIHEEIYSGSYSSSILRALPVLQQACEQLAPGQNLDTLSTDDAIKLARAGATAINKANLSEMEDEQRVQLMLQTHIATLLSADPVTYEVTIRAGERAIRRATSDPKVLDLFNHMKAPDKLRDFVQDLGDARETTYRAFSGGLLMSMLAANKTVKAENMPAHREAMLEYIRDVVQNGAVMESLGRYRTLSEIEAGGEEIEQLNWEFLPAGELTEHAREIVASKNDGQHTPVTIDLARLTILQNIRQWWGEDKSYFAKGVRKSRRVVKDGDNKEYPDEYIVVVLEHHDEMGNVPSEDVVAESPIAGSNALYIQRYDVNGWDWRELMAAPKSDVQAMGARAVKHEVPAGHDLVEYMTEKAKTLLQCSTEIFLNGEFKGKDKHGLPRLRLGRKALEASQTTLYYPENIS